MTRRKLRWADGGPGDMTLDIPHAGTGITPRELADIATTWTVIKNDLSNNGMDLFVNYFAAFPHHQNAFAMFVNQSESELRANPRFRKHCNSVMYAMCTVIENLYDTDCLRSMLHKLGGNHNRELVTEQAFMDLKTTFILWLRQKLGPRLTPATQGAWEKMMTLTTSNIVDGMTNPGSGGTINTNEGSLTR